jgi:1,2-diacylglycerol 3-alpha-glucosyltransferase
MVILDMNIAIFTDSYYPQINGVVTSIRMLENELTNLGHKVYIFTTSNPECKERMSRVFRLPSVPFIFLRKHRVVTMYPIKFLLKFKKLKLDIIHTQTEFGLGHLGKLVSRYYKIPIVHTYHTMYEEYVHYFAKGYLITPKMAQKYMKYYCNSTDAIIVPVEKTKEALLKSGIYKPIHVIATGLELSKLSNDKYSSVEVNSIRERLGIENEDKVVLFVGRIAKEKSIDVIVKQMPHLIKLEPNVKLLLVGEGPYLKNLQKIIEKLGIEKFVIFAGAKPWSEIGKYYNLADVFISASITETQGLTYIEAMAAKKPVVAIKDKSLVGVIENNETGFYFENENEISEILLNVLTDTKNTARVIDNAFDNIKHLSSTEFAKNIESLYLDIVQNNNV